MKLLFVEVGVELVLLLLVKELLYMGGAKVMAGLDGTLGRDGDVLVGSCLMLCWRRLVFLL